jgi:hypothetical protein
MERLYVVIPTYNRAEYLRKTLDVIVPQLGENAICVVFDNCSTDGTDQVVADASLRSPFVKVVRHGANIGASANFMRCFEVAQEGWMWVLSDDDAPRPNAVATILDEVSKFPNACYVNFATSLLDKTGVSRSRTLVSTGVDDFVSSVDSFSNLFFITAGVFNLRSCRRYLRVGYLDIGTFGPQVAVVFHALASNPHSETVQSCRYIADHVGIPEWNKEAVSLGVYDLLKLVPGRAARQSLADKILECLPAVPGHGAFRRTLGGLRCSDEILSQDIRRYGVLASTVGRYRFACAFALLCQALVPLGGRTLLRFLHRATSLIRGRGGVADSRLEKSLVDQLRDDGRV